jgi:hypothetical protein
MFWTSMTSETSKILHFRNCTSKLLEQLEGSRTFTNFIAPLLSKNRTEQLCDWGWLEPSIQVTIRCLRLHFDDFTGMPVKFSFVLVVLTQNFPLCKSQALTFRTSSVAPS